MNTNTRESNCRWAEQVCAHAVQALPASEVPAMAAHLAACPDCAQELESLRPIVDSFVGWPQAVLRPATSLHERLARRISAEKGVAARQRPAPMWYEPDWEGVAPGIACKVLSSDSEKHLVSMLVRLAPGAEYPPHTHASTEELHLLDGELWIDDRKLYPGDYNRAEAGSADRRVWSETGCTCLLTTSTQDVLR